MVIYDDFKILSPEKMDLVAKKYFKQLKNSPLFSTPENTDTKQSKSSLENNIFPLLQNVLTEIANIPRLCSKRFYMTRKVEIEKIVNKIYSINNATQNSKQLPKSKNFCEAVKYCINQLCDVLHQLHYQNQNNVDLYMVNIAKDCVELISMIANLFGECKYRN